MTLQYVKPTEEQLVVMQSFRDKYEALERLIIIQSWRDKYEAMLKDLQAKDLQTLEKGRGLSLANTKLEESAICA